MLENAVKKCSTCGAVKQRAAFCKHAGTKDGLNSCCNDCKRVAYYKDAERARATSRAWYAKNRERQIAVSRAWREANPEMMKQSCRAWRAKYPEKQALATGNWAKNNPDKRAAEQNKRYTGQLNRTPKWLTPDDFKAIEFFYSLSEAMTLATGERHHVDHIVPLNGKLVSGLHVPWNLQVLTHRENSRKGNRHE